MEAVALLSKATRHFALCVPLILQTGRAKLNSCSLYTGLRRDLGRAWIHVDSHDFIVGLK